MTQHPMQSLLEGASRRQEVQARTPGQACFSVGVFGVARLAVNFLGVISNVAVISFMWYITRLLLEHLSFTFYQG